MIRFERHPQGGFEITLGRPDGDEPVSLPEKMEFQTRIGERTFFIATSASALRDDFLRQAVEDGVKVSVADEVALRTTFFVITQELGPEEYGDLYPFSRNCFSGVTIRHPSGRDDGPTFICGINPPHIISYEIIPWLNFHRQHLSLPTSRDLELETMAVGQMIARVWRHERQHLVENAMEYQETGKISLKPEDRQYARLNRLRTASLEAAAISFLARLATAGNYKEMAETTLFLSLLVFLLTNSLSGMLFQFHFRSRREREFEKRIDGIIHSSSVLPFTVRTEKE